MIIVDVAAGVYRDKTVASHVRVYGLHGLPGRGFLHPGRQCSGG